MRICDDYIKIQYVDKILESINEFRYLGAGSVFICIPRGLIEEPGIKPPSYLKKSIECSGYL